MTPDEVRALAEEFGFERAILTGTESVGAPPKGRIHPQAQSLTGDPSDIMPDAKSVLMLVMPYRPFQSNPGEAEVDAYYIASNRAHENARKMAQALCERGARAVMTAELRVKPLAARSGLGAYGRNALIAVDPFGTRISLQTIVTDIEPDAAEAPIEGLDRRCENCGLCLRACPTGALRGDGSLDIDRCVRAQAENLPLKESMREAAGASLLGCDICQRVCPRNRDTGLAEISDDLRGALRLERLLSGDYKPLIPYLGKNNARKMRILNRAALAAANRGRRDLVPLLEKLTGEMEPVGEHARWAIDKLNDRKGD